MLWILVLHIIALLIWVGSVLYVPLLISAQVRNRKQFSRLPNGMDSVARLVFSYVASPAAIVAIVAGTFVFVTANTVSFWLLLKLTVVAFLVCLHACLGLLITRLERQETAKLRHFSILLFIGLLACSVSVFWIVLAKPDIPSVLPWSF